mgnify:CR=1 FL=1
MRAAASALFGILLVCGAFRIGVGAVRAFPDFSLFEKIISIVGPLALALFIFYFLWNSAKDDFGKAQA